MTITAKGLPAAPARAASIVALSATMRMCNAIWRISDALSFRRAASTPISLDDALLAGLQQPQRGDQGFEFAAVATERDQDFVLCVAVAWRGTVATARSRRRVLCVMLPNTRRQLPHFGIGFTAHGFKLPDPYRCALGVELRQAFDFCIRCVPGRGQCSGLLAHEQPPDTEAGRHQNDRRQARRSGWASGRQQENGADQAEQQRGAQTEVSRHGAGSARLGVRWAEKGPPHGSRGCRIVK